MTQQELEKYLWGAATAYAAPSMPGITSNTSFRLLFFKRISDVYDEEFECPGGK